MKLLSLLSSLALLGVLSGAQAAPVETALQLEASSGRVVLRVQPHFRTDVEFPTPIVRVTGTGAPYRFAIRGRVLTLHAVSWPKGDDRFAAPCSLNVFLAGRAYQVDVVPDWNQSQHLIQVMDATLTSESQPVEPVSLSRRDQLFLAFIASHGHLSGAPERSAFQSLQLPNGWRVRVARAVSFGLWDFLAGTLTVPAGQGPAAAADMNNLNLFPGRTGQVAVPGLEELRGQPQGSRTLPLYYLYLKRK